MITLILAVLLALGTVAGVHFGADWGWWSSAFAGLGAFAAFQFFVGRLIKRRMQAVMDRVQAIMANGQKQLQAKMQRWQLRPPGSIQAAQREIAADTAVFVKEAIAVTEELSAYRLWVPMLARQQATAKLQLSWMIKDFKTVDALMDEALYFDPMMSAIRLARLYMLEKPTEELAKLYHKGVRRLKYNQNVLLAALWSWILVQRGDADGAFKVLTEALKMSDNETLKRNHTELMNNRVAHFSNSGLGDQWYSLLLEEPRVRTQRQRW